MTLIARSLNYGFPVLIGDILMTSNTKQDEIHIPTFLRGVEEFLPKTQEGFPVLLRQKFMSYMIDYVSLLVETCMK
ncbi:MAG: hypothetical protein ICV53_23850 [Flavisolibacter sp.]|nr:hypothetical protein [Flavisolibacter sp.]MBD0369123.1 hypothetical protein [Flavisolibacter sp.]